MIHHSDAKNPKQIEKNIFQKKREKENTN